MIKKRFQTYGKQGLVWSNWFVFSNGTREEFEKIIANKSNKYQYGKTLLNEFKYEED